MLMMIVRQRALSQTAAAAVAADTHALSDQEEAADVRRASNRTDELKKTDYATSSDLDCCRDRASAGCQQCCQLDTAAAMAAAARRRAL